MAERLNEKLKARMERLRIGPLLDKAVDIGAIVAPVQLDRIRWLVERVAGAVRPMSQPSWAFATVSSFYPSTLFTNVSPAVEIAQV